jgi:HSP20 family protein
MFYPTVRSYLRGKNNIDNFFDSYGNPKPLSGSKSFSPPTNIFSDNNTVTIELSVPGFSRNDINIEVDNGTLVIYGEFNDNKEKIDQNYHLSEFKTRSFKRSWDLDDTVNVDNIDACYESGILTINIPFKTRKKTSRKIDVQ